MYKFVLLVLTINTILWADDRLYNHGACFVEYVENDSAKYYLTWSSAHNNGWEHDIYHRGIYFSSAGEVVDILPSKRYIGTGSDEAQEPIHAAVNHMNSLFLSVWEDGSDSDAPNVRGQLHKADGTIVRENWIIAGGVGSQHSANTSHLDETYIVLYADEAAPATKGAVVKAKVIDDSTGEEKQTIVFSPYDQDHWWPVSVSNSKQDHTLVAWGNDGYAIMGTVLKKSVDSIAMVKEPYDFMINSQQYFYQVEWLDALQQFLIVARHGAYENITDSSKICLVDTLGEVRKRIFIDGGIVREAKMAVRTNQDSSVSVLFPVEQNRLAHLTIKKEDIGYSYTDTIVESGNSHDWVSTGIWGAVIKSVTGNELIADSIQTLFIQNDTASNEILLQHNRFSLSFFGDEIPVISPVIEKNNIRVTSFNKRVYLPNEFNGSSYTVVDTKGRVLLKGHVTGVINLRDITTSGVYFLQVESPALRNLSIKIIL